jgi:hypothetical protein
MGVAAGADFSILERVVLQAGAKPVLCVDIESLRSGISKGAGCIVVSEEILGGGNIAALREALAAQQEWSEIPVLLLTNDREESPAVLKAREELGAVLPLDWPARLTALDTGLRMALSTRRRQREIHNLLEERTRLNSELERRLEALHASEARHAFLVRLGDALRPLTDTARAEVETCRLLGEHFGADRVHYVVIREDEGIGVVRPGFARHGAASLVGRHPLAGFTELTTVLRSGKPLAITHIETSPLLSERTRSACAAIDSRAFVSVPLVRDGKIVWTLNVTSAAPREWTADEASLVQEAAERTWAGVEQARAESADGREGVARRAESVLSEEKGFAHERL